MNRKNEWKESDTPVNLEITVGYITLTPLVISSWAYLFKEKLISKIRTNNLLPYAAVFST